MIDKFLVCPVCYCEYNNTTHLPKIIFNCGHTVCTNCVKSLLTSTRKCPLDMQAFTHQQNQIDAFPINVAVKQLIEERMNLELCQTHSQKIRAVCLDDKVKVCDDCILSGNHQGHRVRQITKIAQEAKDRKNKLKDSMDVLVKHDMEVNLALTNKRLVLNDSIKQKFDEMRRKILLTELDMLGAVNTFIDVEREKATQDFGAQAGIRKEFAKKIEDHNNVMKQEKFFDIIEEGVDGTLSKVVPSKLEEYLEGINDKLSKVGEIVQEVFETTEEAQLYAGNFPEKFKAKIEKNLGNDYFLKASSSEQTIELKTNFRLKFDDKKLILNLSEGMGGIPKPQSINLTQLNKITEIHYMFEGKTLVDDDINLLYVIGDKVQDLEVLNVKFPPKGVDDEILIRVLSSMYNKLGNVKEAEIWLEKCLITDRGLNYVSNNILLKMTNLIKLNITLDYANITDLSIQVLSDSVLPVLSKLEFFRIDLFRTKITDGGAINIFKRVRDLKGFYIHLQSTQVTDKAIEFLAYETLPLLTSLESFGIWLRNTHVTDNSMIPFFMNVKNLVRFKLDLKTTKVTDTSLNVFLEVTMAQLQPLKYLVLYLDSTEVSAGVKNKVDEIMRNYNEEEVK